MRYKREGKPKYSGERRSFGKPSFSRDRPSRVSSFDVECDKCGKQCQVPFRPTNGKPVYCRDCFTKNDERPQRGESRSDMRRESRGSDDMAEIHRKLDLIMEALDIK